MGASFFGKLPLAGDFLAVGIDGATGDAFREWAVDGVTYCRDQDPDGWREAYLSAPIWRFASRAGVFGPAPRVGVMMPSVDSVGRLFPAFASATTVEQSPALALAAASRTLDQFEALLMSTLAEGAQRADFDAGFEALAAAAEALALDADVAARPGLAPTQDDPGAALAAAYATLIDGADIGSAWWTRDGRDDMANARASAAFFRPGAPSADDWPMLLGRIDRGHLGGAHG